MREVLEELEESSKKKALINAGFEEFAKHGFRKTSVNNIIANADISKGLFYHYYESKEEFYEDLQKITVAIVHNPQLVEQHLQISDLLTRVERIVEDRSKIIQHYRYIFRFGIGAIKEMKEMPGELKTYIEGTRDKLFTQNLDMSLFRDDIDKQKCVQTIRWMVEQLVESVLSMGEEQKQTFDISILTQSIKDYTKLFRTAFYK